MPDPATGPKLGETLDIRTLGRKARHNQISGNALMAVALGLAVLASVLLLWAGIVEGPARVILLLSAAILLPVRVLITRLSAVTLADGVEGSTNSTTRRWLNHWQVAGLLLAGGLCAFGSGHDMGAVMGAVCGGLLLAAGFRGRTSSGYLLGLYPTSMLAVTAIVAVFEPSWGWRGQTFLVGLNVIAAVLVVQVLRPRAGRRVSGADPSRKDAGRKDGGQKDAGQTDVGQTDVGQTGS
jgi:hypothetical protein